MTMNEFFARADIKEQQHIQMCFPYGSVQHRNAFIELLRIAQEHGAVRYFETLADYDATLDRIVGKQSADS